MKYPYIKFYVRDWVSDPQLRMVSLSARGLWIEMLCVMHMATRRGYLETTTGVPIDDDMICRLTGTFKDDLYRCKEELLKNGIPSIEESTGVWFCRRIVKEAAKADKCSEAGRAGGGNPRLSNTVEEKPETRNHISLKVTFKGQFDEFWKTYPRKVGKPKAEKAYLSAVKRDTPENILRGLNKHISAWSDPQYIPHATTWLNRDGWNDEPLSRQPLRNQSTPTQQAQSYQYTPSM